MTDLSTIMERPCEMKRFLIVTPILNAESFIRENLATVAAQTDGDWVHYYVDGGSTDGTLEALEQAVVNDERVRLICGKDRGLFDAWFKGFEKAELDGEINDQTICVWLGADDLLMPWAFATLRGQFDRTGATWIATLPSIWDINGNLQIVQPFNWYPRLLIRAGQFNNRCLGTIQMESVFFTKGLLSKLPEDVRETIRTKKLAGDFTLWREFARHAELMPFMTTVSGFRSHGTNLSLVHEDGYFKEIAASGVWLPPGWLGKIPRAVFRQLALIRSSIDFRKSWQSFNSRK